MGLVGRRFALRYFVNRLGWTFVDLAYHWAWCYLGLSHFEFIHVHWMTKPNNLSSIRSPTPANPKMAEMMTVTSVMEILMDG